MLAKERGIALVIDETYRDLIPSGHPHMLFSPTTDWEWRKNFIHLFSFSKSYCVPGHRLGAIVASPTFLNQVNTVLDCMQVRMKSLSPRSHDFSLDQICPPRPIQIALSPLVAGLRPFIRGTTQSLVKRHDLFRSILPPGWTIGSQGGYYAFVRHPFEGVSALDVSMRLAKEMGVVTLPASFFGLGLDNRWIRFSIANVNEESLLKVRERLVECERTFGV